MQKPIVHTTRTTIMGMRHMRPSSLVLAAWGVICLLVFGFLLTAQSKVQAAAPVLRPHAVTTAVPRPDHIVVVVEENHSYSQIIGNTDAPYINSLAGQGALFTNSQAVIHPSQPNYLYLYSGSNQGTVEDECPPLLAPFTTANLGSSLIGAGFSFGSYLEDLPSIGSTVCRSGQYYRKHNPAINFSNVPPTTNQPFTNFPTDYSTLPTLSLVVPNQDNDMHDGTIAQGDAWLQGHIEGYRQWAMTHNSLLIVTWDEDGDNTPTNQIATIFVGPMVVPGQYAESINHLNVLRTLEDAYALPYAGLSGNFQPITDVWTGGSLTMTPSAGTPSRTATSAATQTSGATATGTPGCAPLFSIASSPNSGASLNYLHGVSGAASSDVWAVGYTYNVNSTVLQTLTQHWAGTGWNLVPSPNVGADNNFLQGVSARAGSDTWAVGYYNDGTQNRTLIERWNGTQWSIIPSPNNGTGDNYLTGVSVLASDDVWAVGYYNNAGGLPQTLIEHWNGTQWSIVSSAGPTSSLSRLQSVSALSTSDVWAAGYYNTPDGVGRTLTLHWNGTAWSIVTSPNSGAFSNGLQSVSARAANDVWAVGEYYNYAGNVYTGRTLTLHWNGTEWAQVASPNVGAGSNLLYGVSAPASDNVWAVGFYASSSNVAQSLVMRWDGTSWSVVSSPNNGAKSNYLFAVAVLSANDVRSAGSYADAGDVRRTLVIQAEGGCTTGTPTGTAQATGTSTTIAGTTTPQTTATRTPGTATPQVTVTGSPTRATTGTPLATTTATVCSITFSDVPAGSTFYPYVRCLACRGIISGYGDGTFRPGNNVTRGQLSKIIANSAGFAENPTGQTFQDVAPGSPFYLFVERISLHGIVGGYPCNTAPGEPCVAPQNRPYFRTAANATRGQISKIVALTKQYNDPPGEQLFQDVAPGSPFYQYVQQLARRNILGGYPCNTAPGEPCVAPQNRPYFRPGDNAGRGQTAKIVSNAFFPACWP